MAIQDFKKDVNEATSDLERHESQLRERQAEYQAAQDVIASSKRRGEMLGTTKEDVFRKKGRSRRRHFNHLETDMGAFSLAWSDYLEDLHGWKLLRVTPELFEIAHTPFNLIIRAPMVSFQPRLGDIVIEAGRGSEPTPKLKQFPAFIEAVIDSGTRAIRSKTSAKPRDVSSISDWLVVKLNLVVVDRSVSRCACGIT